MKFQVPQFVELETKIVGPFTLKQFLWVAAGGSTLILFYILFEGLWFFIFAIPILIIFGGLAFLKIEGIPLLNYVSYMFSYILNPRKYTFKKEDEQDITELTQKQSSSDKNVTE